MKNLRFISSLVMIIALVVISFNNAHAQRAPVRMIKGIVIDSATTAQVPNATITFTATGAGAGRTKTVKVYRDGRFKMRLSNQYFWDMTVSAPGYESYTWRYVNSKKEYKGVLLVVKLKKLSQD